MPAAPDRREPLLLPLVQPSAASVSGLKSMILPASCCEPIIQTGRLNVPSCPGPPAPGAC